MKGLSEKSSLGFGGTLAVLKLLTCGMGLLTSCILFDVFYLGVSFVNFPTTGMVGLGLGGETI